MPKIIVFIPLFIFIFKKLVAKYAWLIIVCDQTGAELLKTLSTLSREFGVVFKVRVLIVDPLDWGNYKVTKV